MPKPTFADIISAVLYCTPSHLKHLLVIRGNVWLAPAVVSSILLDSHIWGPTSLYTCRPEQAMLEKAVEVVMNMSQIDTKVIYLTCDIFCFCFCPCSCSPPPRCPKGRAVAPVGAKSHSIGYRRYPIHNLATYQISIFHI